MAFLEPLLFALCHFQYPLHILVTDNISDETLSLLDEAEALYTIFPRVDFITNGSYALTLNKMYLFSLTQYEKVCFIDGDAIISQNIDAIFKIDPPGFIVFRPKFLSGILMLFDPNTHSIDEFQCKFKTAGTDETIINTMYNVKKVSDLEPFFHNLIHDSHGGTGVQYKYWIAKNILPKFTSV